MDDYPTDPRRDKPLDFYKDAPYPGFENASQKTRPPAPSVRDAPGAVWSTPRRPGASAGW